MAIQIQDFSQGGQGLDFVMPSEVRSNSGLADSGGPMQADMFNQDGLYADRAKAYFMDKFAAPESMPTDEQGNPAAPFNPAGTNTSVLDGNKYINDQKVGGRMYNPYTKLYGSKATRNFNPGNITGMGGKLLYGASRIARSNHGDAGDRGQLVFDNARDGWRAMRGLMSSERYNNAPINKAFSKWQSDKNAWGNMVTNMEAEGINTNDTFNKLPLDKQLRFMRIRARHEGYKGRDVDAGMFA